MTTQTEKLWWKTGVIYQIYPRSFKDSSGNGVGDLNGVIEKLDYLSDVLGVDAIWLSPFYPSPLADFGYDVSDYTDVDPLFGDLATFGELLRQAQQRDLKVIIDFVPNHTSDQHPWFVESRSSRNDPKRDWYVWSDAKPDGSIPNNWLSVFGGGAWEWDEKTEQYYLHSFLKEQPDLNWRNPEVKAAMFAVLKFWLERGVDGFRVDVAHFIMKDPKLRDNPPNPDHVHDYAKPMGQYNTQRHLYNKGHPDVHGVYREFRRLLEAYSETKPRMAVGEIHITDWPEWASYYGKELDELHMPFNFALLGVAWKAQAVREVVDRLEAVLPPRAWPNYVLGNHDELRIASRYGTAQTHVAAMLLLSLRGMPTLYYGDEIGMENGIIPPDMVQDPWDKRVPGCGRDPGRTPMQWDASSNAGFTHHDSTPWLPIAKEFREINVEKQLEQPTSLLSLYRRLLAFRRNSSALLEGSYRALDDVAQSCFVFLRQSDAHSLLVALNFSDDEQTLEFPELGVGQLKISTFLDREGELDLKRFSLRANEGLLVELLRRSD